jgi:hypothetical protein
MKKIVLIIMIVATTNRAQTFEDLPFTPASISKKNSPSFLDIPVDEFSYTASDSTVTDDKFLATIEEYDKTITDNVTPAPVGNMEAFFKKMLGSVLVSYIRLRQKAYSSYEHFKRVCKKWYRSIMA